MSVQASVVQSAGPPSGPAATRSGGPAPQPGTETAFAAAMGAWLALLQALDNPAPVPSAGTLSTGGAESNNVGPMLQVVAGQGIGLQRPEGLVLRAASTALEQAASSGNAQTDPILAASPQENLVQDPVLAGRPTETGMMRPGTQMPTALAGDIAQPGRFQVQAEGTPGAWQMDAPRPARPHTAERPSSQETSLLTGGAVPAAGPTAPAQAEKAAVDAQPAAPTAQIADRVQAAMARGEREATLRLNPPDLGRVHIRLQVHDGQLHLSIRAEHAETGRLIDQRLTDLREGLTLRGLHVGEIRVDAEKVNSFDPNARAMRPGQMDLGGDLSRQGQQQPHPGAFAAMADGRNGERGWSHFVAPSGEREDERVIRQTMGPMESVQRSGLTLQGIDTYA